MTIGATLVAFVSCATTAKSSISGVVTRDVACQQTGVGSLYVGLMDKRPDRSDDVSMLAFDAVVADYSEDGSAFSYTIDDIDVGTKGFVSAFLDENGSADPDDPWPDLGDLISYPPVPVEIAAEPNHIDLVFEAVCDVSPDHEKSGSGI